MNHQRPHLWHSCLAAIGGTVAFVMPCVAQTPPAVTAGCSAGQVFQMPEGRVPDMRYEPLGGGVFRIFYTLSSTEQQARFLIGLEYSLDGGATFRTAKAVEGDVGPDIPPGARMMTWFSSRDGVPAVALTLLRFHVVASGGVAPPKTGSLRVESLPTGAEAFLDNRLCGTTPIRVDMNAGAHDLLLKKDGFVDLHQQVQIVAGDNRTLAIALQRAPTPAAGAVCRLLCWSAAAAAGGTLVWFSLEKDKAQSSFDEYMDARTLETIATARSATLSARRNRNIAAWSGGIAAGVATVTLVVGVLHRHPSRPDTTKTIHWDVDARPRSLAVGVTARY